MAGDSERNRSLREALFESLSAVLSPDHATRVAGEEQVKALEVTEDFGVHLAEFTVDPQGALAIRQLASVLLKQYVEVHWSQISEKFRPPETAEAAKTSIRRILPVGLKEGISKVRSSVAYAVSAIAHWDWPEQWPELFQILMEALTSGDAVAVHGAMRVLTEFCREITDTQMPLVAPVILPEMLKIFTQAEVYGIRTRGRAVDIFNTCATMISAMNDLQKGFAKQLLYPVLPQFTQAFIQALQVPDGLTSDSGLKMEVLKVLTTIVKNFPAHMSQWLNQILPPVWNTLTQSADIYVKTVVNNTEDADDPVDSDGEVLGFENLVYGVFEFIHGMIDTAKFRSTIRKSMEHLLYYVILYMQMTEDQVRIWTSSPDQFVEDEDDDSFSYSVRISAQDLLLSLGSEFPKEATPGVAAVVQRHLHEARQSYIAGDPNWWKTHEAVMLSLGSVKRLVLDGIEEHKMQFDLNAFLQNVVLEDLKQNVSPFLLGRCLWIASRYTHSMSPDILQKFLEATVMGLDIKQPPSVRISAIRAVYEYCDHLKSTNNTRALLPYMTQIMEGILTIATQFSADVLALVMETLQVVLGVDEQLCSTYETRVTPLVIAIFLKYNSDPLIVGLACDIFRVLSENQACITPVQTRLVPTLASILNAPLDKIPIGMQAVALDILQTLVRTNKAPLSDSLVTHAFPACVQCTLRTDDNSTMQSGGECVRAYVSVGLEQVAQWQDGQGNNGLHYVVQIVSKLLDPKTSEYTATFVGRLVSILISKLGNQLGENLDLMLRAVLSKMQQAETLSVVQSLVLVFAHLMHSQMEAVLEFLYSVPDPMGKPALEFVLTEWCSKQHLFYGSYEGKVSSVALCKLLLHAIKSNDTRLQGFEVRGDLIHNTTEGIRTRSKTKTTPDEWTTVPVLVKIYKLLINELSNQIENALSSKQALIDEDDEDEDGDWADDEAVAQGGGEGQQSLTDILSQFAPASEYAGYSDYADDDDEEDDPDAYTDPIYQIELQRYLTDFLVQLSQQPCYTMFREHHSEQEKQVLRTIGIAV